MDSSEDKGIKMELTFTEECIVKLIAAAACGALLGLERKHHNQDLVLKPLYMRSQTIVSRLLPDILRLTEVHSLVSFKQT